MRERGLVLSSLENTRPLKDFDLLGFTLLYEMSYSNILNMLDLGGVPILAKDRTLDDPFVCAGDAACSTANPWRISWISACWGTGNGSSRK